TPTVVIEAPKPAAVVEPKPEPEPKPAVPPAKRSETFLVGPAGEEREDFSYRLNSDGSVRETVVYFYGDDLRASQASGFDPLRREAVYQGRVDTSRLYAARKMSDTLYIGEAGQQRRRVRREEPTRGNPARAVRLHHESG